MAYLHKGMTIAGIWGNETITGVPVSIDAVDSNGNNIHIADVTTDGYSGAFGYTWKPEITGQYTITATFMGDESYGSSFDTNICRHYRKSSLNSYTGNNSDSSSPRQHTLCYRNWNRHYSRNSLRWSVAVKEEIIIFSFFLFFSARIN